MRRQKNKRLLPVHADPTAPATRSHVANGPSFPTQPQTQFSSDFLLTTSILLTTTDTRKSRHISAAQGSRSQTGCQTKSVHGQSLHGMGLVTSASWRTALSRKASGQIGLTGFVRNSKVLTRPVLLCGGWVYLYLEE